ncbi:T9SS sorting signal type C domain-containing protein [Flavobacterium sp. ST-87]|uniref:T9SS sorting signal type C domain-containing protein n=1 Tax=Flavobacterium plantiphilum TaxID=3163297 RepID=A0ABW8XQV8_9FLAO
MNKNYFTSFVPINSLKTCCFLLVICFLLSVSIAAQTTKTLMSSGTLEIPAGVTSLSVQAWGAGGGGGGADKLVGLVSLLAAGGGGGGGAFNTGNVNVGTSPNNVRVNYVVGIGGAGEISPTNRNGAPGGASTFPSSTVPAFLYTSVVANGGTGGNKGGVNLTTLVGDGGAGGVGLYSGGKGNSASLLNLGLTLVSGGGGGGAGSNGNGLNSTNGVLSRAGGAGGAGTSVDEMGGSGADGLVGQINVLGAITLGGTSNGEDGFAPGGGGGGGAILLNVLGSGIRGGKGGDGQIKVTYTCPTYSITSLSADADCEQSRTITLHSTPEGLPIGTYTVTYTIDGGVVPPPPATMVVGTAGTGTIEVQELRTVGVTTVTITHLSSVDCSTAVNASIIFDRPAVPVQGTITHPTCAEPTGSVELSGLPDGSWTINPGEYAGTGSTATISGLASGTQSFVVSKGDCSSQTVSVPFTVVINDPPPVRTWEDGEWDEVPTLENKVIFASNYDEDADVQACSCKVNTGAYVVFKTGRYLQIRNELVVDDGGSLTFENNASLVQMNDAAVNLDSGNIIYKRHTMPVKRYDFTYWSSPVAGQMMKALSPHTLFDKYYSYDPVMGWEIEYNGGVLPMVAGNGYIIRAPQTFSITDAAIDASPVFEGKPNNGEFTKNIAGNRVHLLGNPYPSALDADAFLTANMDIDPVTGDNNGPLDGTLYFWTHNSPPSDNADPFLGNDNAPANDPAIYNYTTSDYAGYNLTGGVGTAATVDSDANDPNDNNNLSVPTGLIAAAQGFFAPASATGGDIVFNNSMRFTINEEEEEEVMDNSQFFKLGKSGKSTVKIEKNRLWLNLTNAEGAFKQTLIGYITGATNDYEGRFDGVSYDGNQFVDFYSVNQDVNLAIQGRALPFQEQDSVALGYKSTIKGDFKISIDHSDGVLASQKVFLEDKLLAVLHDLKEPYSFTTEKGIFNNRFILRYQDKDALTEDVSDMAVEGVVISNQNKVITINTSDEIIKTIYVYDFSGSLIYSDTEVNLETVTISNISGVHQVLIVKAVLENGKTAVKKIIY